MGRVPLEITLIARQDTAHASGARNDETFRKDAMMKTFLIVMVLAPMTVPLLIAVARLLTEGRHPVDRLHHR